MSENVSSDRPDGDEPPTERAIDPETLLRTGSVPAGERTYRHETDDHCEADADGRAIVGATNDAGAVLLLANRDAGYATLPSAVVGPDDDWIDVARRAVTEVVDAAVTVGEPERLRRVEHVDEATGERQDVTHHVVFRGTVAESPAPEPTVDADGVEAGWFDELPVEFDTDWTHAAQEDVYDDVRQFLD